MQENHVSSHAGKHVKRFGNDEFPLGNYIRYPPTIAGSVESMSFPAETRLVGIWTRSMEGSR